VKKDSSYSPQRCKERTVCKNQHWLIWQYLWRTGSRKVFGV